MPAKYSAHDVARFVVEFACEQGSPITNLQLQKILFFLQWDYARRHGGQLLFDEDFEAWQYGPVVPSVYFDYSDFGGTPITEPVLRSYAFGRGFLDTVPLDFSDATDIEPCLTGLLRKPAWQLVEESHRQGGPWSSAFARNGKRSVIGKELIIAYRP